MSTPPSLYRCAAKLMPYGKWAKPRAAEAGRGGAGAWHDRFTHHDRHHIERQLAKGVVMERKKREAMENVRLPASFYDVSAL